MTVRGVSQNVIATSGEASVTSQEFGGEVVSVTINTYEAGKQPWYDSWQQPISWSDMRKYFDPVFGVDARKLIDDLESNVQSLEDYLDTAFIKTYGGVAQGVIKFLQGIQVSGPYGLGYISFVGSTGSAIDYTGLMNITGITTGSSNYLTLNSEGMIIKSNRSGVDPYITFVDYPSISGDSATLTRKGTGSAARLELDNNLTISARNPVLRIEETGTTDNVDLELMQTGSNTEGLRLRYESNTGHSRITNIYSAGNLYLNTNNQSANGIIITPAGQILMSNQPAVQAYMKNGWVTTTAGTVPFNGTLVNRGNHFNVGTYLFTCPVAGLYGVWCYILTANDGSSTDMRIQYNGAMTGQSGYSVNAGAVISHKQGHIQGLLQCAAGDTIGIASWAAGYNWYGDPTYAHSSLIIQLLG